MRSLSVLIALRDKQVLSKMIQTYSKRAKMLAASTLSQ